MQLSRLAALVVGGLALSAPFAGQAQAPGYDPGQWQITSTILSVDMAGMPPQVAQMMTNRPTTMSICITPDMAAKGQSGKPPGECPWVRCRWRAEKCPPP